MEIVKVVDFTLMESPHVFNLCFGDSETGDEIDDFANSNNGDMKRVLATVIHVAVDFLSRNPKAIVYFTGSTKTRTNLYQRILRTHYKQLSVKFEIYVSNNLTDKTTHMKFNPDSKMLYKHFLITEKY